MGEKESYLNEVLMRTRMPGGVPVLSPFHGGDYYYTHKVIFWQPEEAYVGRFQRVEVPPGFVTDLASVPPPFWAVLPRDGAYLHAAIVHDYAYWVQKDTRETADEVLRIGMQELGVPVLKLTAICTALRLPWVGGRRSWARNANLRAAGERRVLKRCPDDPRITWSEWKTRRGVFADQE